MNTLLGLVILVTAAYGAKRLVAGTLANRMATFLAGSTVFFAIFLVAFLSQGFLELALGRPLISLPIALGFTLVVCAASFARRRTTVSPPSATLPVEAPWHRIPLATAIAVGLVFVAGAALLAFGVPRGYEVRAYHLPLAIRVLRDGTLGIWDSSFMHAYPVNMSVWAGFFLHLVPERLVSLINLPFLALLCAAVFALSRALGADRSAALLVAAGTATVPIIGFSALEIGADVGGVAFLAIAVYLIAEGPGPRNVCALFAGIAAGMAYGFKSLHLVPATMLGLLLVIECGFESRRRTRNGTRATVGAFAPVPIYAFAALAMMSFWLVRNYLQAGNPLYPVYVPKVFDLFSWKAAPDFDLSSRQGMELEWVGATWQWLIYPWTEGHVIDQNFKHSSGLGAFFAAVIPTVVVLWPMHLLALRRDDRPFPAQVRPQAMVYCLALTVVVAWCVLGDRQPRYVMAAIVLLLALGGWLVVQVRGRLRTSYEGLLSFCVLAMAFVILVRLLATNGATVAQNAHFTRHDWLEYPAEIDRLPQGSLIANGIDREVNYLLLGDGLRNHVMDAAQVNRRFAAKDELQLTGPRVAQSGITHLYIAADRKLTTDDCVSLDEVDRLDHNPFNGRQFDAARILYRVTSKCAASP